MSNKPNIPVKSSGDTFSAQELNTIVNFFENKPDAEELIPGPEGPQGIQGIQGPEGPKGVDGQSAYSIAVENGYVGTEQEWIESLSPVRYMDGDIFEGDGETPETKTTIKDGSIEEEKLSDEVRGKLNADSGGDNPLNSIQLLVSKMESSIYNNPRTREVMDNPPIITVNNGTPEPGLTRIYRAASDNQLISSAPFTYMGGRAKVFGGEFVRFPAVKISESGGNVDDGEFAYAWRVGFVSDCAKISIGFLQGLSYRFIVDGQYVSLDRTSLGSGQPSYITLDFTSVGGRKIREIMIEGFQAGGLHSVSVLPIESIWKLPRGYRLAVVGQSYEQGAGSTSVNNGYVPIMGDYLGFSDVRQIAEGSTGYTFGSSKYIDRINDWTGDNTPDLLVLAGALHDISSPDGELRDAVVYLIQQTRLLLPNVPIVTLAIMAASSGPSQGHLDNENEIKEAVDFINDPLVKFIPVSTDPTGAWLRGTGYEMSPTGNGNSDIYIGGEWGYDETHPNNAGHNYLGVRGAKAILQAVKSMLIP